MPAVSPPGRPRRTSLSGYFEICDWGRLDAEGWFPNDPATQSQVAIPTLATTLKKVVGAEDASKFSVQATNGGELGAADSLQKLRELSANIKAFIDGKASLFSEHTAGARDELLRMGLNAWRGKLSRDEQREVSPYRDAAEELVTEG